MEEKKTFSQKIFALQWLWGPLGIVISCAIGIGAVVYLLRNVIFRDGLAPGSDVPSFAHTTKVILDYLIANHRFPPIDLSWYAGFELQAAPPMVYWYLGIIYLITQNLELSTRILHLLALVIIFMVMFLVMKKEKAPTLNALIAALVFTFIPENMMSIQSWTKLIALFLLPVLFYFANQILKNPQNQLKNIALIAVAMGLTVYSHPMNAVVYAISLVLYGIIYSFLDQKMEFRRIFLVILGLGLGIVLASSYLLPFIFQPPGESFSRAALWEYSSIVNPEQVFQLKSTISLLGGWLVILIIPFITLFRTRNPKITALYLTGIIVMLIAFAYVYLPLGAIFPFKLSYSYVWIYITCFTLAYVFGMAVPFGPIGKLSHYFGRLALGILLAVLFYFQIYQTPSFLTLSSQSSLPSEIKLAKYIDNFSNQGRIFQSHYPLGKLSWSLWLFSGKTEVEGHYYGVSRAGKEIALMNDAIHNQYPEYVLKKLRNFNIRYFIANQILLGKLRDPRTGDFIGQKIVKKIEEAGWQMQYEINLYEDLNSAKKSIDRLYYLDNPSTYVQPVEGEILAIGKYGPTLAAAASPLKINILEANSIYLDDYDLDFLKRFKVIFLYGFGYRNKDQAEQIAKDYVRSGGKLIIELFGVENSKLEENPEFLGVTGNPIKITSPLTIETKEDVRNLLPATFELPGEIMDIRSDAILSYNPMKEWNALEYLNLDQSLARFSSEDDFYSILGYKNVGESKVFFVGANIFYHLYNTHDPKELELVSRLIRNLAGSSDLVNNHKSLSDQDFRAEEEKLNNEYWRFKVSSKTDRLALISLAYSPNWRVYVDSKPVRVYQAENLMVVKLPAGEHKLEIKYQKSVIKILSTAISILTFVFLISLVLYNQYIKAKQAKKTRSL
ncbi:MAG: 6-pyruvoyl-tetrahydropterin synthase-related protein [Patescibacteria group bacterium]|mgnify:CR=1 FL=1